MDVENVRRYEKACRCCLFNKDDSLLMIKRAHQASENIASLLGQAKGLLGVNAPVFI
jgi:hypothetical protein